MTFSKTHFLWAAALVLLAADPPPRGGVLRVAQRAEPKTFNPVTAIDAPSREVIRRMHADLLSIDRITQKVVPSLADSWSVSRDGRTFKLHLRAGVRFSDGHPFTSDDVAFTFEVLQDPKTGSPQRDLLVFDDKPVHVRIHGPLEVEFELPRTYAAAERLFDSIAILPRHLLEAPFKAGKLRDAWTLSSTAAEIAGLGPFRLKQYKPGESVLLERNPYYWQAGKPYLDGVEFRFVPDQQMQLAQFAAGHLDLLNRLPAQAAGYLQSKGLHVTDAGPSLEYNFVCFNQTPGKSNPVFENPLFRRALSAAVDRTALVRIAYDGRGEALWGPVTSANKLWYLEPAQKPNHDHAQARRLLRQAGWSWDAQGRLLAPKPVTLPVLVSASSEERIRMANVLAADWKELGIDVRVVTLEFRALLDRVMRTREFDAVILGLGGGDADPNPEMGVWLSSGPMHLWNPEQKQPATKWEAELDGLMREQMAAVDPRKRRALYHRALRIIEEQQPMIFLASPHVLVAEGPRAGGVRPAAMDHYTLWNIQDLYLRKSAGAP